MKHIIQYNQYNESFLKNVYNKYFKKEEISKEEYKHPGFLQTRKEIDNWLSKMRVFNYHFTWDKGDFNNEKRSLRVNVDTYVDLKNKDIDYLPIKFGYTKSFFDCSKNNLKSLEGCPIEVNGYFDCSNNELTTLQGSPEFVNCIIPHRFGFKCDNNKLITLEGCTQNINGGFSFGENKIFSLKGFPQNINCDTLSYGNNPIYSFLKLIHNVGLENILIFIKYLNEYNAISENKIILDSLKEALYMIDMQEDFDYDGLYKLKNYKIID